MFEVTWNWTHRIYINISGNVTSNCVMHASGSPSKTPRFQEWCCCQGEKGLKWILHTYPIIRLYLTWWLQVQHPGVQDLMMTDIRNLQAFALYMQKTDIKFDLYSVTREMEKQVCQHFTFASIYTVLNYIYIIKTLLSLPIHLFLGKSWLHPSFC